MSISREANLEVENFYAYRAKPEDGVYLQLNRSLSSYAPIIKLLAASLLFCSKDANGKIVPMYCLPCDIWVEIILTFIDFDFKTLHIMSTLSRSVGLFFQNRLKDTGLERLHQHIVNANVREAERIILESPLITNNPRLLLQVGPIVNDSSGRKIQQSAYQIAIATGSEVVKCMIIVLSRYLRDFDEEELTIYRDQLFPEGIEAYIKTKDEDDTRALHEIFEVIRQAQAIAEIDLIEECNEALTKFKSYLSSKSVIKTGMHFNPQILSSAYQLYFESRFTWGRGPVKENYIWQKIIGLIQHNLTARDAFSLGSDFLSCKSSSDPNKVLGINCAYLSTYSYSGLMAGVSMNECKESMERWSSWATEARNYILETLFKIERTPSGNSFRTSSW